MVVTPLVIRVASVACGFAQCLALVALLTICITSAAESIRAAASLTALSVEAR